MSDVQIEFDIVAGKNELPLEIDRISKASKAATESVKGTTDSFKSLGNEAKKASSSGQSGFSNFKSQITSMITPVTAAIAGITAIGYSLKRFVDAAVESEENVSRLNVALEQTGIYSEQTSKDFQNLATQIQNTTRYSDDQAMSLMTTLQNLGQFTKEGLQKATKASVELASAMKIDLESAALLVGKAATGNVTAFQRMGIEIKKGATDAETFANTLEALSRFQGASAKDAQTLGGSFANLGNQVGEATETIGFFIADILKLKERSISAAQGIKAMNEEAKKDPVATYFKKAVEFASLMSPQLRTALTVYKAFKGEVEQNPIKVTIETENAIQAQGKPYASGIAALTSLNSNNLAPNGAMQTIEEIAKASKIAEDLVQNTKARQAEQDLKAKEERDKIRKDYDSLLAQTKNAGKTQLEIIQTERSERLRLIDSLRSKNAITISEEKSAKILAEKDFYAKKAELDKKNADERRKIEKDLAKWINDQSKKNEEDRAKRVLDFQNASLGAATNILQGREGARTLISGGIGAASEAFAPGTGQAAGALASQLMQGPEANREMIRQFAAAVPELVSGIIESIPAIIEELSNQFPKVIDAMVNKFNDPKFIENIGKAFIKAGIAQAKGFVQAMINFIPNFFKDFGQNLISAIVDGIKQAFGAFGDVAGNFVKSIPIVGDVISGVGDFLGFARGGQVNQVPNGFPNDTFPAMLSSGELVVDRSTVQRLNDFIDQGASSQSSVSESLLVRILDKLSEPMNVNTTANVNGKAFADIILNLNRSGARLTV